MRGISVFFLSLLLLQFGCAANAQPPTPLPGPGPIPPGAEIQTPPTVSTPPEKPIGVPIGRLEDYEEGKRKAGETTGSPPGTVQEDPAARQRRDKPSSSEEK